MYIHSTPRLKNHNSTPNQCCQKWADTFFFLQLEIRVEFTLQPVPEIVKPHAGQLTVVLLQYVANSVEPLVKLVQQWLDLGIICPLRHHIHVVEGEELELGTDEVILAGLSGYDVCQLQAIPHLSGPVQTDSQQAEEQYNHNHLESEG